MTKTAKLFITGGSRAVRLPAEFRFDSTEVYVRRDGTTGDVILSRRPGSRWDDFIALRAELGALPDDSLAERGQSSRTRDRLAGFED